MHSGQGASHATEPRSRSRVDAASPDGGQNARCVMPFLLWIVLPLAFMDTLAYPQHADKKKQKEKQDE